ncbi:MAG: serine/threonine-protein kinase [Acidobacteriota bacterium]
MTPSDAPQTIGRYEIRERLGRGAVGEVFLARDPLLDRYVAIKVLSVLGGLPSDEQQEVRARFQREARAAAALSHPSIVTIHDVGEHQGVPFIAMEYLRGVTLDRHTRSGHLLPQTQVLTCGRQAALALAEAHTAGIVHRDIKPANLILLEDGSLKVADFGLAKDPRTSLTSDQSLLGTPNYMSPEQIAGRPLDGRSDLFSLAVSLFELITGHRPFAGESISSVLYRIVNEPPRKVSELTPGAMPEFDAFFDRALAKDPGQRFPNASEFANALDQLRSRLTGESAPAQRPIPAPPRPADPLSATSPTTSVNAIAKRTPRRLWPYSVPFLLLIGLSALWTAPRWIGWDPLGGQRVRVEDWLSSHLGSVGAAVRISEPERVYQIATVPAGLRLESSPPGLIDEEGRLRIRGKLATPIQIGINDPCWVGTASVNGGETLERIQLDAQPARVRIPLVSDPAAAMVALDGATLQSTTPVELDLAVCDSHSVQISASGRVTAEIALTAREVDRWRTTLSAVSLIAAQVPTGVLRIPKSVEYSLVVENSAGQRVGASGSSITLPVGKQRLTLRAPSVLYEERILVEIAAGTKTLQHNLPKLGMLTVFAVPPGGRVLMHSADHEAIEVGTTPLQEKAVVEGEYTVIVEHPDGAGTVKRAVRVTAGRTETLKIGKDQWR